MIYLVENCLKSLDFHALQKLYTIYKESRNKVTTLIAEAKQDYYKERISSSDDTQKTLFACVKELLNQNKPAKLPSSDNPLELANRISTYFKEKITKIRIHLEEVQKIFAMDQGPEVLLVDKHDYLTSFDETTEDEVKKIIMASASNLVS